VDRVVQSTDEKTDEKRGNKETTVAVGASDPPEKIQMEMAQNE
jgi:hypothetical protein